MKPTSSFRGNNMDDGMQRENGRHKFDYYKGIAAPWNMMSQHHMREQNALPMNRKILAIISERDAAIHERDIALAEKRQALVDRDAAQKQRDEAISQRNSALMERDNAIAALQYSNEFGHGMQRGTKHADHPFDGERRITEALPLSFVTMYDVKSCQAKRTKGRRKAPSSKASRKREDTGEDLNKRIPSNGVVKMRSEWDSHELGLNLITFDESTMPAPICSCTGKARQCYKWGSGGWQSACCTTTLSMYPLPQMLNKRHSRMGGRKMSGNVFTRLLTRLAASGHDLSMPVDLKDHWARHGTNRYIIIK